MEQAVPMCLNESGTHTVIPVPVATEALCRFLRNLGFSACPDQSQMTIFPHPGEFVVAAMADMLAQDIVDRRPPRTPKYETNVYAVISGRLRHNALPGAPQVFFWPSLEAA
ncbi:hypothetical protein KBD11_01150 [Candidatus Saccharibacteria bacterium]|nr:hypothetical protein [Candidatus Saccharibacteria bacterium]